MALEKRIWGALEELQISLRTFFRQDLVKEEVPVLRLKDLMAALGVNVSSPDLDSYLAYRKLNTLKGFRLIEFISSFQHEENLEMKKQHK